MKTIVLTGGGTAGHVIPNMALLPGLKKHFENIYYIGTNGIEKEIATSYGLPFFEITAVKLRRKEVIKNLSLPFKLASSINKAKKILKELKPDIIFSKGGFVALPVVIAGKFLKIPIVSHESDLSFGLANKLILPFAKTVCTSFESTAKKSKKCVFTGSPIRNKIFEGNKEKAKLACNFKMKKPVLMFFGGSLGAKAINDFIFDNFDLLTTKYNIIHIVGKNNKTNHSNDSYYQMEFTNTIEDFFAYADVVISRGGANSLFELLAIKKPMIIIPLPKLESRGDQIENAKYFQRKGYAKVIYQEELTITKFLDTMKNLNPKLLISKMEKAPEQDANKKIIREIMLLVK